MAYLLVCSLASLCRYKPFVTAPARTSKRFAVFIAAYREDAVILPTVHACLAQDYPDDRYDVVVISDHMRPETNAVLSSLPIKLLQVDFEKSTNTCVYVLIFALAYAGNYLFNAINLRKYISFSFRKIDLRCHLNSVLVLAITAISNEIYVTLDTFMLGILSTNAEIGYYSNSMKLMRILINVVTAVGTVILPRLSKLQRDNQRQAFDEIINKVIKILMWITIPCTIGIMMMSQPIVVVLFGRDFEPAATIMCILALLIIPRAFSNMSLQVLICTKNDTKTSIVYFTGMLINCFLNAFLINDYGAKGAAVASVISEAYICIILFIYSKKLYDFEINRHFVFSLLGSAIFMGIGVMTIQYVLVSKSVNEFLILCLGVLTGVTIYVGLSIVSRNEVTVYLLNKTIKRLRIRKEEL